MDMEIKTVEISKLQLKEGDILIASVQGNVSMEKSEHLKHKLLESVPDGVNVLVINADNLKLYVLTND